MSVVVTALGCIAVSFFVGYCWARKPHPPPPAAPLYDDITVTTTPGTQLEMKENVAYGPGKQLQMEDNVAYGIVTAK